MKRKIVIFDMDGTVLDTLEDLKNGLNFALRTCGYPERSREEVRSFVGNGAKKLIERGVPAGTGREEQRRVYEVFASFYKSHCGERTAPYPGILQALERLKSEGFLLAVLSNKPHAAVELLCEKYFKNTFDFALGQREGIPHKPAPDGVFEILSFAGVKKENALYVGDSDVDIQTARNAGIFGIAVDWGFRDRAVLQEALPDLLLSDPAQLADAVKKQFSGDFS